MSLLQVALPKLMIYRVAYVRGMQVGDSLIEIMSEDDLSIVDAN
jgi:hypothetical protein